MAERLGDAVLELRTDDSKYYSGLNKAKAGAQGLEKSFQKTGRALLDTMSKLSMVGLAAFKMVQQIGRGIKDLTDAYAKQANAEAKRNQILKTTGNIVNKTTSELNQMASEMQSLTGIGDEVIINAQGIMLTFKQIGEEIFPRAMDAAVDLSAAFDTDLKSSTVMLGKALEDIPRGLSSLRRVGVTFTEEAENMALALWEMGKKAEAQKIILEGVEAQVKGVAAAMGKEGVGQIKKYEAAMGDAKEEIGKFLTEMITPVTKGVTDFLEKNKGKIYAFFKGFPEVASLTFETIKKIIAKTFSFEGIKTQFAIFGRYMMFVFKTAIEIVPKLFVSVLSILTAPVRHFGAWLMSVFEKIFGSIANFFIDALNEIPFVEIQRVQEKQVKELGDVWDEMVNDIGGNLENIAKAGGVAIENAGDLIKGIGEEYKNLYGTEVENYLNKLDKVLEKHKSINEEVAETARTFGGISAEVPEAARPYVGMGGYAAPVGVGRAATPATGGAGVIEGVLSSLSSFGGGLRSAVGSVSNFIKVINPFSTILEGVMEVLEPVINEILQPLVSKLKILGATIGKIVLPIFEVIGKITRKLTEAFVWFYNKAILPVGNFIITLIGTIGNFFIRIANALIDVINLFRRRSRHMAHVEKIDIESKKLKAISLEDALGAGEADTETGDTVTGAAATYEQARPIVVNIDIHDNDVFGGSLRDFAILIRNEFDALGVLGL